MEDSDDIEAATEIAIECGALKRCSVCGETWTTDEFDPDDEESMEELAFAARAKVEADPELEDLGDALAVHLAQAISSAASEKGCDH